MRWYRRLLLVSLAMVASFAGAQDARADWVPEIRSFSGSPLLLEIAIPDPAQETTQVIVRSANSVQSYSIPAVEGRETIDLQISPFFAPGIHDLAIETAAASGEARVAEYRIGFVRWIWGSSNMRFGNNGDYESVIGTYGEILQSWVEDRFGERSTAEMITLIDHMYKFFGARSGRCYAFAGSELRYWLWPDQLPSYYDEAYDIRLRSSINQRALNYLQLDMAFSHFLQGGASFAPRDEADPDEANGTLGDVKHAIDGGTPAVIGLMGPNLHHAMLAYGYIENTQAGYSDILVANNWKSEQNVNLRSRNAEFVRVYHNGAPDEDTPIVDWHYADGSRNKTVTRLFQVPVLEAFDLNGDVLDYLVQTRLADLAARRRAIVIVEDAARASVTDGEATTGYAPGLVEELEGVVLDKVNRTYLFEVPSDAELTLDFADQNGTRVLYFHPEDEGGDAYGWIAQTPDPDGTALVRRQTILGIDAPSWDEEIAAE